MSREAWLALVLVIWAITLVSVGAVIGWALN